MSARPIFSRDADLETIRHLDRTGLILLSAMAIVTAILSGVGFVNQFPNAGLFEFSMAVLFGFSVWLIAKMFWLGAWILPQFMLGGSLLAAYIVVAAIGFLAFGTVSYFGNQRAIAGDVSQLLSQEARIDELENAASAAVANADSLRAVEAKLSAQAAQSQAAANAELSGAGPTGVGGSGPVHRSFLAATSRYREATRLVSGKLVSSERIASSVTDLLRDMRAAREDTSLDPSELSAELKALSGQIIAAINQIRALDVAGTARSAAQIIAQGVPNQSGAAASSQARIAEIRSEMASFARSLEDQADSWVGSVPDAPRAYSLSQEEHLIDNFLRMPGLSMAALFFDFCGWVVIGFRFVAYRALRRRDEDAHAYQYDAYLTRADLNRVAAMAQHVSETCRMLETMREVPPAFPQIDNPKNEDR